MVHSVTMYLGEDVCQVTLAVKGDHAQSILRWNRYLQCAGHWKIHNWSFVPGHVYRAWVVLLGGGGVRVPVYCGTIGRLEIRSNFRLLEMEYRIAECKARKFLSFYHGS